MQDENMTQEREAAILEKAVETFGEKAHIVTAISSMSDLQNALVRTLAGYPDKACLLMSIAKVCMAMDILQLIYGDAVEQELEQLEELSQFMAELEKE